MHHFIPFKSTKGNFEMETFIVGETLWLTIENLADLLEKDEMSLIKNIAIVFESGNLDENVAVQNFLITKIRGKQKIVLNSKHYNLAVVESLSTLLNANQARLFVVEAKKILANDLDRSFILPNWSSLISDFSSSNISESHLSKGILLKHFTLSSTIIKEFEKCIELPYVHKKTTESNVCFINSDELRSDFRLNFGSNDLFNYCFAVLHSEMNYYSDFENLKLKSPRIPFPKDAKTFWELAALGGKLD